MRLLVECLRCGATREAELHREGDCPRCGYVGWAAAKDLDEPTRRALHARALERQLLRPVA